MCSPKKISIIITTYICYFLCSTSITLANAPSYQGKNTNHNVTNQQSKLVSQDKNKQSKQTTKKEAITKVKYPKPSLVVDPYSLEVFYHEDIFQRWYPASLTKLMTAYVVLTLVDQKIFELNTPIVISANATKAEPTKIGYMAGDIISLDTALKALLTRSANDVAIAISENIAGNTKDFVELMNHAADVLGMKDSKFSNPSGLPSKDNYSTAYDLAILAVTLWRQFPHYRYYFGIPKVSIDNITLHNTNSLMNNFKGVNGMKTGYICDSGFNMITSATRDGNSLIVVSLGNFSKIERNERTAKLLTDAFKDIKDDNYNHPLFNELSASMMERIDSIVSLRKEICQNNNKGTTTTITTQPRLLSDKEKQANGKDLDAVKLTYIFKVERPKKKPKANIKTSNQKVNPISATKASNHAVNKELGKEKYPANNGAVAGLY